MKCDNKSCSSFCKDAKNNCESYSNINYCKHAIIQEKSAQVRRSDSEAVNLPLYDVRREDLIKIEKYADNGALSHYELISRKTGETFWFSGTPEISGRYLVIYKQNNIIKPFVSDFDEMGDKWINLLEDVEIIWWRTIPPYII